MINGEKLVEKEIDGTIYKARFMGMAYAFSLQELSRGKSEFELTETLFNEVLVSPKTEIDDFEDMDALEKVRSFLLDVALGNIHKPLSNSRMRRQVEEEWACWRLIYCDMASFDYNTVFYQMTPLEIEKANIALDKVYKEIKARQKKK